MKPWVRITLACTVFIALLAVRDATAGAPTEQLRTQVDKVLKQRNALLKGAGGRLDESAGFTLDVWDAKLVESEPAGGSVLGEAPEQVRLHFDEPVRFEESSESEPLGPYPGLQRGGHSGGQE